MVSFPDSWTIPAVCGLCNRKSAASPLPCEEMQKQMEGWTLTPRYQAPGLQWICDEHEP